MGFQESSHRRLINYSNLVLVYVLVNGNWKFTFIVFSCETLKTVAYIVLTGAQRSKTMQLSSPLSDQRRGMSSVQFIKWQQTIRKFNQNCLRECHSWRNVLSHQHSAI